MAETLGELRPKADLRNFRIAWNGRNGWTNVPVIFPGNRVSYQAAVVPRLGI